MNQNSLQNQNILYDSLSVWARKKPDSVFLRNPEGEVVTYGSFFEASAKLAALFRVRGVQPGDRIAILAHKSVHVLESYIASVQVGAVFLPLNPEYTHSELKYLLADAEPSLLIADDGVVEDLSAEIEKIGIGEVLTLNRDNSGTLPESIPTLETIDHPVPRAASDIAAILYTSGTTGHPKGAMLSHRSLLSNSKALVSLWKFTPDDILLHALPIFHTHGLFVATNVSLLAGCSIRFFRSFDPDALVRAIPDSTTMMGVPTFYTRLLQHPMLARDLASRFRLFISGSAPLLAETHAEWKCRTGHEILERYGMTEANMITSIPYEGPRTPGTVGLPLPRVEARIRHPENGTEVRKGQIGVLEIRGPGLFSGYWRSPEKTRSEFRDDGFFITGDLARTNENEYIVIEGRAKDLVISGGMNVYPTEIEAILDGVKGVEESAVIGVPHPDFGEGVVAVVTCNNDRRPTEDEIIAATRSRLANYKRPKRIFFTESLPRNSMGKVQKTVLREQYQRIFVTR